MTLASRARKGASMAADALVVDPAAQLVQMLSAVPGVNDSVRANGHGKTGPRYRELLEALGVAVYTTDRHGRITFYNQAAADFWGRRPRLGEEWCGSWKLYWTDGRPLKHSECPMAIALKENRPVRGYEAVAERPDGSRVSFEPYPTPIRDGKGKLVGGVNVLVDVTERRSAEDALRAAAAQLKASNEVKDEFLGLVSHELRTPVTTIYGNARLLQQRGHRLSERDKESMIEDIADDSGRLLGIIDNLLLLTRLESGGHVDLEPQMLTHLVRKSVRAFRRRRPGRRITFSAGTRPVIVEADATYVELLMDNLLSNAHKYSSPEAKIDVTVRVVDGEAHVLVLDRGIGIDDVEAARLFTPFYRTQAASKFAAGMGVGLALCKRLVESQNGRIWARPRENGGTELGFALPLGSHLVD